MICPLYAFCKYYSKDSLDCIKNPNTCSYFNKVNNWIDLKIEVALEDLQ